MTRRDPQEESDEMLMALADGELDDPTAAELRRRIGADPALAARFALFAETRDSLRAAFPPGAGADPLIATIMAGAQPAAVLPFRPASRVMPRALRPVAGWALAASVMLAVGLGGFLAGRATPWGPDGTSAGLSAMAPLQQAAEVLAAIPTGGEAALPGGATARALGSFETDLGLCRLIEAGAERGLMCRDAAGWALAVAVPGAGAGQGYLPASDLGTGLIDAALDRIGAGPALDPGAEAALLTP